jgi:uncharacterized membrane protein YoaK (UPF0700 family)
LGSCLRPKRKTAEYMLVREGEERDDDIDRRLASYLAAVAGALNAAAFHAVGFFSANMTGNVSSLSSQVATRNWLPGLFYLAILVAFIFGAISSTLMINVGRRRRIHRIYAYSILTEAILLIVLAAIDICSSGAWRISLVVVGLAYLMGLQNAVVTKISEARIRTTHVSGMITDMGVEIANILDMTLRRELPEEGDENRKRLELHFYTVVSFLAGGIVGVVAYEIVGGYLLLLCAIILFWVAFAGGFRNEHQQLQSSISVD